MKKILAMVLVAIISLSPILNAAAIVEPEAMRLDIHASCRLCGYTWVHVCGRPGDEISIDVYLSNNTGLTSMTFAIPYDADVLTPVSTAKAPDFPAEFQPYHITDDVKYPTAYLWAHFRTEKGTDYNGVIYTATFKVNEDAPAGNASSLWCHARQAEYFGQILPIESGIHYPIIVRPLPAQTYTINYDLTNYGLGTISDEFEVGTPAVAMEFPPEVKKDGYLPSWEISCKPKSIDEFYAPHSGTFTFKPGDVIPYSENFGDDWLWSSVNVVWQPAAGFAGGDGTKENPYQVSTPAQLDNVRNYLDAHFIQINDIDMTGATAEGEGWLPVGDYESGFTGTYDGGKFKIIGLKIDRSGEYAGLFGYNQGTIKNLGIEGGNVNEKVHSGYHSYAGGLVGYNDGGIIANCYNTGDVSSLGQSSYVGGIAGYNNGGTIANCYSTGDVFTSSDEDYSYSGGIAGHNNDGTITDCYNIGDVSSFGAPDKSRAGGIVGGNSGQITNCYNKGKVFSSNSYDYSYAGGIAGYNDGGTIANCYNTGDISSVYSGSYSFSYAGGVAGYNHAGTIVNCYNTGDVSSVSSSSSYVGGVAGFNNDGIITDCYNTGNVSSVSDSISYAGGIVGDGINYEGYSEILVNCYNTGNISGSSGYDKPTYVGGIMGCNDYGTITNCHNTGGVSCDSSGSAYVGGIVGANMSNESYSGILINCYNTGNVSGISDNDQPTNAGGIVGNNNYGTITNCYNTGNVSSDVRRGDCTSRAAGIVGRNYYGAITNCYNTGNVSALFGHQGTYAGGIYASNINGKIAYCYWNSDSQLVVDDGTKIVYIPDAGPTTPKTTAEMKDIKFVTLLNENKGDGASWAFDTLNINNGYPVFGETAIDPTPFAGGDGSLKNPYQVSTPAQLDNVRNYLDAHFIQINDIDMTDATAEGGAYYNGGEGWEPIGGVTNEKAFYGTYDGRGHKIIGLKINRNVNYFTNIFIGLFGINVGTIKNLGMEDGNIAGKSSPVIHNVSVGSIAGMNGDEATITNCYNTGKIFADSHFSYAGGIAGSNGYGTITDCYNTGDVSSYSLAATYAGGIVGKLGACDEGYAKIINCYNTGNISAASDASDYYSSYGGGITGSSDRAIITDCYNTGDVSSALSNSSIYYSSYAGGIAGDSGDTAITNCYNAGDVSSSVFAGGIAGSNDGCRLTYCYWNIDSDQTVNGAKVADADKKGVGDGKGDTTISKTTKEMKSFAFVTLLNENRGGNSAWAMDAENVNGGYPVFGDWVSPGYKVCGKVYLDGAIVTDAQVSVFTMKGKVGTSLIDDGGFYNFNLPFDGGSEYCFRIDWIKNADGKLEDFESTPYWVDLSNIILPDVIGASYVFDLYATRKSTPKFVISDVAGAPGEEVNVAVSIANNPGIASFKLRLHFDNDKLEPVSVTRGNALAVGTFVSNINASPDYVTAVWFDAQDIKNNGALFTVKFRIKDSAGKGATPLKLTYSANDVTNENSEIVELICIDGSISIANYIYGALLGESEASGMSVVKIAKHLAEAEDIVFPLQLKAADVYADGIIDGRDLIRMAQYLAEWEGVELGVK